MEAKKLEFIDALRGIAALAIVIYHLVYIPLPNLKYPLVVDKFIRNGGSGVILFFVISAFTLFLSNDNRKTESNKTIKFYVRRFFRIAPLFYFMLLCWIPVYLYGLKTLISKKDILFNITFIYNFFPSKVESLVWAGWTIGVEMLFYLLIPILFIKITNLRKAVIWTFYSILTSDLFNHIIKIEFNLPKEILNRYLLMNFVNQLPVFLIGTVCFFIWRDIIYKKVNIGEEKALASLLLSVFVLLFIGIINRSVDFLIPEIYWKAIGFSLLVLSLSLWPMKLIVNKITCFYGKISYSIYLIHPLLIQSMIPVYRNIYAHFYILFSLLLCFLVTILLLTPIALLTYYIIESPGIRYSKKLILKL